MTAQGVEYAVREIEHSWITMGDGVRLAARIWLPETTQPVPAILTYSPYFARLFTRAGEDARFPYYAKYGYACVRVDIRGSGNSEGTPLDEYVRQEQDDGVEIIRWIAVQSWCSGAIGMEGISWSGFNALQVAARRPPALKAIITHCSTDDRYTDDAHFKGGCIIHDMFNWGTLFLAFQGQAPDPDIIGAEVWRRRWLARLEALDFQLGHWLEHQHRDSFWKHGSVRENYTQIACPVYAIGGWVDGYKNSIFRLLSGLSVPRKGLIGPWAHVYPHRAVPGPAIGYLDEALRWWGHWLKGVDTGLMDEPMLRVWMQHKVATSREATVPGRWVAEEVWPSPHITERSYFLNEGGILDTISGQEEEIRLHPLQTTGSASGNWCPSGMGAPNDLNTELPFDQRFDDARSLLFDSAPLREPFEILGAPVVTLEIAVDKPIAFIAVRLNEVLANRESRRITYGILNLCHYLGSDAPANLKPGRRYTVRVHLDNTAHRFTAGGRIRLAISTAYWPLILPAPEPVFLSVFTARSTLALPVRPMQPHDALLQPFATATVPTIPVKMLSSKPGSHIVEWDAVNERQVIYHEVSNGAMLLTAINTQLIGENKMRGEIGEHDTTASLEYEYLMGWERDRWRPRVLASSKVTTTRATFLIEGAIKAFDGEEEVLTRKWTKAIPRSFV